MVSLCLWWTVMSTYILPLFLMISLALKGLVRGFKAEAISKFHLTEGRVLRSIEIDVIRFCYPRVT